MNFAVKIHPFSEAGRVNIERPIKRGRPRIYATAQDKATADTQRKREKRQKVAARERGLPYSNFYNLHLPSIMPPADYGHPIQHLDNAESRNGEPDPVGHLAQELAEQLVKFQGCCNDCHRAAQRNHMEDPNEQISLAVYLEFTLKLGPDVLSNETHRLQLNRL
ncbi:hypothetical protein B0J15DRAFT_468267 [Fusarium solani]|uniref:Uncharacterized protein n=1 Tax=Fusarium solani TaxID=169388 RepID=A0A9P9H0Q3_FUSSL|nr:uncharacterized protein B0J15DRAFT_468267 [Fusarium solani]KAH7248243.1 hypothetical protein B0J15DRAFT_468267 [Fusarium solani]